MCPLVCLLAHSSIGGAFEGALNEFYSVTFKVKVELIK